MVNWLNRLHARHARQRGNARPQRRRHGDALLQFDLDFLARGQRSSVERNEIRALASRNVDNLDVIAF